MWNLTLRNLRANLARLVSTAVAVITGTPCASASGTRRMPGTRHVAS